MTAIARLADQGEERAVGGNQVIQPLPFEVGGAALEQLLAGIVDTDNGQLAIHHHHHRRQRFEHRVRVDLMAMRYRCFAPLEGLLSHDGVLKPPSDR